MRPSGPRRREGSRHPPVRGSLKAGGVLCCRRQGVPDRLPQAEGRAEEGGAGGDQAEAEGGAEEDEGGGTPAHTPWPSAARAEKWVFLPAVAGWEQGRKGLRASPTPLAGARGRPGRRVGGWSGRGAAVTCFHPSAAPGVPEDAEREGGGARYVLALDPRQRGGSVRSGRWAPVVRHPWPNALGWAIGAGAAMLAHHPAGSAPHMSPWEAGQLSGW